MRLPASRRDFLAGAFGAAAAGMSCARKPAPFAGYAVVVTENSRYLSVVDFAAFTLAGKIEFPAPLAQVLFEPKNSLLYALSTAAGTIYEYDWKARVQKRQLKVGRRAVYARFDRNAPDLWVSVAEPASIVRVPLSEFLIHTRVRLDSVPVAFDVSAWETQLAISLEGGGMALLRNPGAPEPAYLRRDEQFGLVRFRSDGRQVLAANHTQLSLSIVRVEDAVPVVDLPVAMKARNFCFKPDGGQLFVTDGESGGVVIVYPYTTEVDRAVLAGKSPGAMVACSSPPYLLVANRVSSDVTVLDLETGRLVAVVPVGAEPAYLSVTPDNQYALALNQKSGDMAVIRLSAVRSRRNKTAPLFTMVPVGEAPRAMAVIPA